MALKSLCLSNLDVAIALNRNLKNLIAENKPKQAIDMIADILYVLGSTLQCINRVEYNQSFLQNEISALKKSSSQKALAASALTARKKQCLQLVDTATNNFLLAKQYIRQNRLEDAENIIAATITGKILRCVNSLTT